MPPTRGDKPPEPRRFWRSLGGRFWVLVLVLLALNYISVAIFAPGREQSVTIPYNPTFLEQVEQGNVTKISAQGQAVSGEFKKAVKYPPDKKDVEAAKNFETQIPEFANTDALSSLLQNNDVTSRPNRSTRGAASCST